MTSPCSEEVFAEIQHFPEKAKNIELLARGNEKFREVCKELAEAEKALASVDYLDEAVRAERRLEWLTFIRQSLSDIDAELRRVKIVPVDFVRRGSCDY